jgi:hypothetical protein
MFAVYLSLLFGESRFLSSYTCNFLSRKLFGVAFLYEMYNLEVLAL